MRWHPHGYGGPRRDPEQVKREGWQEQGVLAVSADDDRLTCPSVNWSDSSARSSTDHVLPTGRRTMAEREWTAECVADHFEEAFRTRASCRR
ncbi:hypothetical protein LWV33_14695 [Brucella intermedia]